MNANVSKSGHVENEVEEVDPVDNIDFQEIGGYVAKESVNDVAIGGNLTHEQRAEFMDLAISFKACSQKPQAQQVWHSIISNLHLTNQLDQDHTQYRIA